MSLNRVGGRNSCSLSSRVGFEVGARERVGIAALKWARICVCEILV